MTERHAWQIVKRARHPKRITSRVLISHLFSDVIEMKGDRLFGDDDAMITGIGTFNGIPVTIIAEEKGKTTADKIKHNFGMPHPEGYRKAKRMMAQAEKFNRPIITIIDTPGAYPGVDAESRGQARAIADNLLFMSGLKVPVISIILGEGGSGGALAIGLCDQVIMFEYAIYSVVSPEGYASIVFKDAARADEAAEHMKLTAHDLMSMGLIDHIITEGPGLEIDPSIGINHLRQTLLSTLKTLMDIPKSDLVAKRDAKYRKIGAYKEDDQTKDNDA